MKQEILDELKACFKELAQLQKQEPNLLKVFTKEQVALVKEVKSLLETSKESGLLVSNTKMADDENPFETLIKSYHFDSKIEDYLITLANITENTAANAQIIQSALDNIQQFYTAALFEKSDRQGLADDKKILPVATRTGIILKVLKAKGFSIGIKDLLSAHQDYINHDLIIKESILNTTTPQIKIGTASLNALIQEKVGTVVEKLSKYAQIGNSKIPIRIKFTDFDLSLKIAVLPNKAFSEKLDGGTIVNALRSTVAFDPLTQKFGMAITTGSVVQPIDLGFFQIIIKFDFFKVNLVEAFNQLKKAITECKSSEEAEAAVSKIITFFDSTFQVQFDKKHALALAEALSGQEWADACDFDKFGVTGSWKIRLEIDYLTVIQNWFAKKMEEQAIKKLNQALLKDAEELAKKGYADDFYESIGKKKVEKQNPFQRFTKNTLEKGGKFGEALKKFGEQSQKIVSDAGKKIAQKMLKNVLAKNTVKLVLRCIPVVGQIMTVVECVQAGYAILQWVGVIKPYEGTDYIAVELYGYPKDACVEFSFRKASVKKSIHEVIADKFGSSANVMDLPLEIKITVYFQGCNAEMLSERDENSELKLKSGKGNIVRIKDNVQGYISAEEAHKEMLYYLDKAPLKLNQITAQ